MPLDSSAPDKTLDVIDVGSDTQKRFRYQAAYAATLALDLLRKDSEFDEIICEQFEDILIKRKDAKFIGCQVKTRNLSKGPFTFDSSEILKTLEGFINCEKKFPNKFKNYVIAANCGFSNRTGDYRNLHLSLGSNADSESILSNASYAKKLNNLSLRVKMPRDFVLSVFKKVRVEETRGMEEYEVYLADQISSVTHANNYKDLKKAAIALINRMAQAASLHHSSPRSAYFALLDNPDYAKTDSIIKSKCITKTTVEEMLEDLTGETQPSGTQKNHDFVSLLRADAKLINNSFRKYAEHIVNDFDNFPSFEREGVRPLIDQLSKFDLKRYFIPVKLKDLSNQLVLPADNAITDWIDRSKLNGLFILGDFGTGKTTLCAHLTCQFALRYLKGKSKRIPILLSLRNVSEISEEAIIQAMSSMIRIDWLTLSSLSESGKLLLILDGFDEMVKRTDWKKTLNDFQNIVKMFCRKKAKVIVTCRTHYFKKDSELWGEDTELMKSLRATEDFKIVFVEQFETNQIKDLIGRRTENPENVWNTIENTYNLRDLCRRPLLLDMIVSSLPKLVALGLSINAATLYESYTGNWVNREDWRSQFTPDQKSKLMEKLACDMFLKDKPNIPFFEIEQIIETELKAKAESDVSEYYDYDIRTCSFFKRDSEGNYFFMHRSFLEFFVAKAIARDINLGYLPSLMNTKLLPSEIIYFAGLLINIKSADTVLNALYTTKGKTLDEGGILGGNSLNLYKELRCSLENLDFSSVTVRGARLKSFLIDNCKFENAKFGSMDLSSTKLNQCSFRNASFSLCTFKNVDIQNTNFARANFAESQLTESVFRGVVLNDTEFNVCSFNSIKLINSNIFGAHFYKSDARASRFLGNFGIHFIDSNLELTKFDESRILLSLFYKSNLHSSRFTDSDLDGTCFYSCNCRSSKFDRGSISFSSFFDSSFDHSLFSKTKIYSTFMNEAEMGSVTFDKSSIKRKEKRLHRVCTKGTEVEVCYTKYLPVFCALNGACKKFLLEDNIEDEVIGKFLGITSSPERTISYERFSLAAALLYSALLSTNRPRTLQEIAAEFELSGREIARTYRKLLERGQISIKRVHPKTLVEAYAKELNISKKSELLAKNIIDLATKTLRGKAPSTVAAAAIYFACKDNSEKITQISIAKTANLSITSISKTAQLLSKFKVQIS